jgi:hypothetical protein
MPLYKNIKFQVCQLVLVWIFLLCLSYLPKISIVKKKGGGRLCDDASAI